MKLFKQCIFGIIAGLALASVAMAEPTHKQTKAVWDMPSPPADLAGFYLYWVSQNAVKPYTFTDAARIQIADPLARSAIVVDVNPTASGGLCFALTAYDTSGNESDFGSYPLGSTDACGWFGMVAPNGVVVE